LSDIRELNKVIYVTKSDKRVTSVTRWLNMSLSQVTQSHDTEKITKGFRTR